MVAAAARPASDPRGDALALLAAAHRAGFDGEALASVGGGRIVFQFLDDDEVCVLQVRVPADAPGDGAATLVLPASALATAAAEAGAGPWSIEADDAPDAPALSLEGGEARATLRAGAVAPPADGLGALALRDGGAEALCRVEGREAASRALAALARPAAAGAERALVGRGGLAWDAGAHVACSRPWTPGGDGTGGGAYCAARLARLAEVGAAAPAGWLALYACGPSAPLVAEIGPADGAAWTATFALSPLADP